MEGIKICVIGAGSSYTPELLEGLSASRLPIRAVTLYDINEERLNIMGGFSVRYAKKIGMKAEITCTSDLPEALEGSDFVNVQIRVGGNEARTLDEKIPLKYGLVGQETTGAGGFMKALRTIPVMLDLAQAVQRYCPDAWIINYTNPTGIVAEAVNMHSKAKIAGLCAGGFFPKEAVAKTLGVCPDSVRYDYFGLNHLNFGYNITVNGKHLTDEQFGLVAENTKMDPVLLKHLRLLPITYLKWYFNTSSMIENSRKKQLTRGEEVMEIEKEIFAAVSDPSCDTKPEALKKRGGGGYSELALAVMDSIYFNTDRWLIINVPNRGTVRFLPDDAVIETSCMVNSAGIKPLTVTEIPNTVWGLVCAVKNYEQLAVKAAVTGDISDARLALLAHPLVRDFDILSPMLDEMLHANRRYLPQFFK